jgi:hypothetical protein
MVGILLQVMCFKLGKVIPTIKKFPVLEPTTSPKRSSSKKDKNKEIYMDNKNKCSQHRREYMSDTDMKETDGILHANIGNDTNCCLVGGEACAGSKGGQPRVNALHIANNYHHHQTFKHQI